MNEFSEKQLQFLKTKLRQFNILSGVTGSGKSFVANIKVYAEICRLPSGSNVLLTGNTTDTLYKNVIKDLLVIDQGINWLDYTRSPAMIRSRNGAECFCIGINNEGSDKRIKGGNSELWYADEVTTYPKSAFDMCLSRCRGEDGGKLVQKPSVWTLNPDNPGHYIKAQYIDKRDLIGASYWEFGFQDNPIITQEYIDQQKKLYTGIFYERMIEGKWIGDVERLIFPEFIGKERELVIEHPRPKYFVWYGALDPGFQDYTAYLVGYHDFMSDKIVIEGEVLQKQKNSEEIASHIRGLETEMFGQRKPQLRVSDTDWILISNLNQLHGLTFMATKKDDKEAAINNVRVLFNQGKILINPRCKNLIYQLKTGLWDKNKIKFERTDDGHCDLLDALIYLVRNINTGINPYPEYDESVGIATHFIPASKKHNGLATALLGR